MEFLSTQDKARVRDAIATAERKTSGEFVTVLTESSNAYLFFPMLWTAIVGLLVPGVLIVVGAGFGSLASYALQIAVVVVAALVFFHQGIRVRLAPKHFRHHYASRAAHEQFVAQGVHKTRDSSGVLLFVSARERHVEIIADEGIHANVGEAKWQEIVDAFVAKVKNGQIADGFSDAVTSIGEAMASAYPYTADDENELPNGLVEL